MSLSCHAVPFWGIKIPGFHYPSEIPHVKETRGPKMLQSFFNSTIKDMKSTLYKVREN